ncbi:MAG: hypothetical protein H7Y00_14570, partial [Fimbriimonadaceae bacterium]|nr:hypothetical protein [Chitinophagales bacterium]
MLTTKLHAQVIGGNGEGFTKAYSQEDIPFLQTLTKQHPLAIRWPGGSDAKLAFPSLNVPGIGIRKDSVYSLYEKFKDENGLVKDEALNKDLRKAEMDKLEGRSALIDLIEISKEVKNFEVIYSLNVMTGTAQSNVSAIQTLLDSGVNIIGIVAGNETFYSYEYDWERYEHDFEPIIILCKEKFPNIPRLLCIAHEPKRKTHNSWNTGLIKYVKETGDLISGTDVHLYLAEELKAAAQVHPKQIVFKRNTYYETLDSAFQKYIRIYKQ